MKKSMKILIKFPIQLLATEVSYCFQSQILNFFIINLFKINYWKDNNQSENTCISSIFPHSK